jgi:3-hydroxybutyrate dehydrogenase
MEGGPVGITANAVCPGYVFTPIVENQIPDQMKAHNMSREEVIEKVFLKEHAVKEFITVDAIAEAVLFLTDSAAASVTTGIALPVDAGWTAH